MVLEIERDMGVVVQRFLLSLAMHWPTSELSVFGLCRSLNRQSVIVGSGPYKITSPIAVYASLFDWFVSVWKSWERVKRLSKRVKDQRTTQ